MFKRGRRVFQKLIFLGIFSLSLNLHARAPGTYSQLRSDLQRVSQRHLIEWVNGLVKAGSPSRMIGHPGHDKARDYLKEVILKLDSKKSGKLILTSTSPDVQTIKDFYQKDFNDKVKSKMEPSHPEYVKWMRFTSAIQSLAESKKSSQVENIIWEKSGLRTDKVLVITAHYDTISHDKETLVVNETSEMPGANYNASGVSVALGLIQVLSQIDLNYSVQVVFLDWQGIGYYGSYLHSKELKNSGKDILGVVNLEMLGQDTSYLDKTKKTGNMAVYVRNDAQELKWVQKLVEHGSKITQRVSFEIRPNHFENSDNFRYWENGHLCATFTQNWEDDFNIKFYQTSLDTPETLNQETLWHAYQYLGGATLGILLDLTK